MPENNDPIQELLIAARRTQILDAATKVFAEKGFHRATVKDIARTAGIADGTIYTYFSSKNDVLLGILDRLNETTERAAQLEQAGEQDLQTFFKTYVRQRMNLLWPNAEVFRVIISEMLVNAELRETYRHEVLIPTFKIAEQYLKLWIDAGRLRKMDPTLAARAIASTVFGLLITQLLGDQEIAERWEELPDLLSVLLIEGLKPAEESSLKHVSE